MTSPFSGRGGWVWSIADQYFGDVNAVIADAKAANCDAVFIKSNDDGRRWAQANRDTVERLNAENIRCLWWGYAYGHVQEFVDAAVRIVKDTGCQGYIVDGESELRNTGRAGELARKLRGMLPDFPLGFAPLPIMRFHRALDYPAWAEQGYTLIPQIYSNTLGPQTYPAPDVIREWREAFPDAALAPAYGTYSALEGGFNVQHPTREMMAEFLEACDQYNCIGHSWYRVDTLDVSTLPEDEMKPETLASIQTQLDILYKMAEYQRSKKRQQEQVRAVLAVKRDVGLG